MKTGIVAKSNMLFNGYPDIICFRDYLFTVHNEAQSPISYGKTRIVISVSNLKQNDDLETSDLNFREIETIFEGSSGRWNCPRFSVLQNKLWVFCDYIDQKYPTDFGNNENNKNRIKVFMVYSSDGFQWSKPILTNLHGILPSKVIEFGENYYITTHLKNLIPKGYKFWKSNKSQQLIWKIKNITTGKWTLDHTVQNKKLNLSDGHLFLYGNHLGCIMGEKSGLGLPAYYVIKDFHKKRWSKLKKTLFYGCHRPTVNKLSSEKYLITYREQISVNTRKTHANNTIACLTDGSDFNIFRKFPINYDTATEPDSGYTGWIQLEDKSIIIINYIKADAPEPYIIWHHLTEHDI